LKLHHFTITFALIAITFIVISDIRMEHLNTALNSKIEFDRCIDTAIDDAVRHLLEVGENNQIVINKEKAIESFFTSLYASFGILTNRDMQKQLDLYFPVIAVTVEDGYYIYYWDEYKDSDENTYAIHRWSEKLPYFYEDENFLYRFTLDDHIILFDKNDKLEPSGIQKVYQLNYNDIGDKFPYAFDTSEHILLNHDKFHTLRKTTIASLIENSMAYYISHHNKIASNYGITYNFSLPPISHNEWLPYLDNCSIFVVFQGYPFGNEAGDVYNRFASAGAKISKDALYYIEQVDWYRIYHRSGCPEMKEDRYLFDTEPYFTVEECVNEGAYACPICNNTGINAPEYFVH